MASKDIADVLIIGSGASGAVCAWHLSSVPGIKVVCLEQGEWRRMTPSHMFADPEGVEDAHRQSLLAPPRRKGAMYFRGGYPYDYTESDWAPILGHAVGGATTHFGAQWHRMKPSDFLVRSLTGAGDDWPISYWDLAPYYDWIDNTVGVTGVPGNPAYPPKNVKLLPAYPLTKISEFAMRAFEKLGWHAWPGEAAVLTVPFSGRKACTASRQTPGHMRGDEETCPAEAKGRADVVFWPEAIRNGVVFKIRSRVREITVNKRGLADGVRYYDAEGRLHKQQARLVVVACNGIGTPRLLLNSKSATYPQGLANSSGLVGKYLGAGGGTGGSVAGEVEEDLYDPNPLATGLFCHEFYENDFARGFIGNVTLSVGDPNVYSSAYDKSKRAALGDEFPWAPRIFLASQRGSNRSRIPWGEAHHAAFQERAVRTVRVRVGAATEPANEANRVELDPTLTDDLGIPAPKLFHEAERSENGEKAVAWGIERAKELLEAMGAKKIRQERRTVRVMGGAVIPQAGHYYGTARMGSDPERSVVDGWGRAHDVKNLFIIDGSVFTMSRGAATSTVQTIALRTADYIKNNFRDLVTA